jgi:hypothetical protein
LEEEPVMVQPDGSPAKDALPDFVVHISNGEGVSTASNNLYTFKKQLVALK